MAGLLVYHQQSSHIKYWSRSRPLAQTMTTDGASASEGESSRHPHPWEVVEMPDARAKLVRGATHRVSSLSTVHSRWHGSRMSGFFFEGWRQPLTPSPLSPAPNHTSWPIQHTLYTPLGDSPARRGAQRGGAGAAASREPTPPCSTERLRAQTVMLTHSFLQRLGLQ